MEPIFGIRCGVIDRDTRVCWMHQHQIAWSTEVRGMSLLQRKNRVRMRCGCACRALRADVLRQSWRAYSIKIRSESSFVEFGASKAPVNEHAAGARWRAQARLGLFIWTRRRPRLPLLNGLPPPHTECQNPLFPVRDFRVLKVQQVNFARFLQMPFDIPQDAVDYRCC